MSVSRSTYIIVGFILEDIYSDGQDGEDKVSELASKLKCKFVAYNDGYDSLSKYALVPKHFNEEGTYSFEDLMGLANEVSKIKAKAKELNIELPESTIQAVTFTC